MKKPDMSKAPKWAKLWLWSPEFSNQSGYWAGLPKENGEFQVASVSDAFTPRISLTRLGLWGRAHKEGGMSIKINLKLENK